MRDSSEGCDVIQQSIINGIYERMLLQIRLRNQLTRSEPRQAELLKAKLAGVKQDIALSIGSLG